MHRLLFPSLILAIALCWSHGTLAEGKPLVGVSVAPVGYLVGVIGGDEVDVAVTVAPGQSPATYEPSVQQLQGLRQAKIYFRVGVPFEDRFLPKLTKLFPRLKVVDLREGITLRQLGEHHHHDHHSEAGHVDRVHQHNELDPHIWTAPENMVAMAEVVATALKGIVPDGVLKRRFNQFKQDMIDLHQAAKSRLKNYTGKSFYVFHPSWGYFADAYGLRQVAIEVQGKEPSPQDLARLVREAKAHGIKVIVVQQQFSRRAAQTIAQQVGAKVVAVDPLASDYPKMVMQMIAVLEGALAE